MHSIAQPKSRLSSVVCSNRRHSAWLLSLCTRLSQAAWTTVTLSCTASNILHVTRQLQTVLYATKISLLSTKINTSWRQYVIVCTGFQWLSARLCSWCSTVCEDKDHNTWTMLLPLFSLSELVLDCMIVPQTCTLHYGPCSFRSSSRTVSSNLLSEVRDTDISRSQFKAGLKSRHRFVSVRTRNLHLGELC